MDSDSEYFGETIGRAKRGGHLTEQVKLVMAGQIEYAVQRGDITPIQADRLLDALEPGFKQRYAETIGIALVGEPEGAVEPYAGVYG